MWKNPDTGKLGGYYRLVESYRNETGRVCHRTLLNVGFIDHVAPAQLNQIQRQLTLRAEGKISLFEESDEQVLHLTQFLWDRIVSERGIDLSDQVLEKRRCVVDMGTIRYKELREPGAEWLVYQAASQLKMQAFLQDVGWEEQKVQLALTQLVSRAVYPASELRTSLWIKENPAICELTGYPVEQLTKDKLYQGALSLYGVTDRLEQYLGKRTNELFDLQDKIILYDLTNTYFEG